MDFGYVRVSSRDQNPERQIVKMQELGVSDKCLFVDKESGKTLDRTEYNKMREKLRSGDVLYIDSLDRLGRNYEAVKDEWKHIVHEVGCDIVALDMGGVFDSRNFKGDVGKFIEDMMLTTLSWVADQERKKIKERQAEGIALAKAAGKYRGRTPIKVNEAEFKQEYDLWKSGQISAVLAMKHLGLKANTFYRHVAMLEGRIDNAGKIIKSIPYSNRGESGRQIKVDKEQFELLYGEVQRHERTNKFVMEKLGLNPNSYYRLVKEYKNNAGLWEKPGSHSEVSHGEN